MRAVTFIFLVLVYGNVFAQPHLKPSIGLSALPQDNSAICSIPVFNGSFYTSGYQKGDTIPDFTLYTINGTAVNIKTILQTGKPALLVNGSYTCPVYRGKVPDLNNMVNYYGNKLNVYIVYTVEAHPVVDVSPYSGNVWTTSQNQSDGVLYRQPATYKERKDIVDSMLSHMTITPQVLIDGPCNEWWSNFGPAPNNAYLVDTNGIVRAKHGWFHKLPDNMWCDIDTLLGTNSGNCMAVPGNGTFTFKLEKDSTVTGTAGNTLEVHGVFINNSATSTVTLDIIKLRKNIPAGWQTALCTDICLDATVDSTQITIAPADSQSFTFYFYTDTIPSSGNVEVGFRNTQVGGNRAKQTFYAVTKPVSVSKELLQEDVATIYPNPSSGSLNILFNRPVKASVTIINAGGVMIKNIPNREWSGINEIYSAELPPGIYYIKIISGSDVMYKRAVIL